MPKIPWLHSYCSVVCHFIGEYFGANGSNLKVCSIVIFVSNVKHYAMESENVLGIWQ